LLQNTRLRPEARHRSGDVQRPRRARRECPVDAIYSEDDLPPERQRFRDINASYCEHTITTLLLG
jgi:hypothetical protein